MKIDLSIVASADTPEEEKQLSNELEYLERTLLHHMGFIKIRDSDDGAFDTRVISFIRSVVK